MIDMDQLAADWLALWTTDLGLVSKIVAPDFAMHAVPLGSGRLETALGREALTGFIDLYHRCFDETTVYELPPILQHPYFAVRWRSTGTYSGGIPNMPEDAIGRRIDFCGNDILRVEGGLIAELWMSADTAVLMQQLGADQRPKNAADISP